MAAKVELLAPAGNRAMMIAAVQAGANAVYLGGKRYGARAFSDNFSMKEMTEAVEYCHLRGVRVYVTMNTLLRDDELIEAVRDIDELVEIGVDAFILQDMELLRRLRNRYSGITLHASTQTGIGSVYGAEFAKKIGFTRVILARETSIAEIAKIREEVDIEIETFVHGSLCVAYSGACLMSAMIGGRSGNRGRCAQPCRKKYLIVAEDGSVVSKEFLPLISPADLSTIDHLQDLIEAGVTSFKIEGRMKTPEYVYAVVRAYRQKLEGIDPDPITLAVSSNRSFTKGLSFGDFGKTFVNECSNRKGYPVGSVCKKRDETTVRLIAPVQRGDTIEVVDSSGAKVVFEAKQDYKPGEEIANQPALAKLSEGEARKTHSKELDRATKKIVESDNYRTSVSLYLLCRIGEPLQLTAIHEGKSVTVFSEKPVERAKTTAMSEERAVAQLEKLGDSIFYAESVEVEMEQDAFVSISQLNALRRSAVKALNVKILSERRPDVQRRRETVAVRYESREKPEKIKLDIELENQKSVEERRIPGEVSRIYFRSREALNQSYAKRECFFILPHGLEKTAATDIKNFLETQQAYRGVEIHSPGETTLLEDYSDLLITGSSRWNVFNSDSLYCCRTAGLDSVLLSPELSLRQIAALEKGLVDTSCYVYGKLPAMIMKHCPAAILRGCTSKENCLRCKYREGYALRDEKGYDFDFRVDDRVTEVRNSKALHAVEFLPDIVDAGVRRVRLRFTNESADTVVKVIQLYIDALKGIPQKVESPANYTKGQYFRGVE